jgi:hypothetical protein
MAIFLNITIMEILEFIYREGGDPKTWYIGVTNDPRQRLFDEHQVDYQNDAWIYRIASSEGEALQVQAYFLEFGLAEGEEGWQRGACVVYAYRKHAEPFIKARPKAAGVRGNGHRPRHRPSFLPRKQVEPQKSDRDHKAQD